MSAILCRNCGSGNPPGSRFCNQCATPLPPGTHIVCPNCRHHNPLHLVFCDHCGTKLIKDSPAPKVTPAPEPETPTPPKAFSLPTRAAGDTGELHIKAPRVQDWLKREDPSPPPSSAKPTPSPSAPPPPRKPVSQPSSTPETDPALDDFAQWLQDLQTEEQPVVVEQPVPTELPAASLPDLDDWIEEESSEDYLPDWLREAAPRGTGILSPLPPRQTGTLPPSSPPSKPVEQKLPTTSDLPDWLSQLAPPHTGALGKPAPIDDDLIDSLTSEINVPDWLKEMEPPPVRPASRLLTRKSKPLPPLPQEPQPPITPPSAETAPPSEQELPDWLLEFATSRESSKPVSSQEGGIDESFASNLPDWLEEPDIPATGGSIQALGDLGRTVGEVAPPELPDWLTTFATDEESLAPAKLQESGSLPDWLADPDVADQAAPTLTIPTKAGTVEPAQQLPADEPLPPITSTPDWLSEVVSSTSSETSTVGIEMPAADLPDWLNRLTSPSPEEKAGIEEELLTPVVDLPDWLVGDLDETPPTVQATIDAELPDWLSDSETTESADDKLDWLSQFPTPIIKAEDQILAEHTAAGEFPEWLAASQPVSEEQLAGLEFSEETIAADLPDWLTQFTAENRGQSPEKPTEATVPDWLQELSALIPTETAAQPVETPSSTDLPDWLAQMMPADLSQADEVPSSTSGSITVVPELSDIPPDLVGSDLPDWLRDSFTSTTPASPPTKSSQEVPDWLRSADRASKPPVETPIGSDEWSDILGAAPTDELGIKLPPPAPSVKEQTTLVAADIPDWLKPYKPRELRTENEAAMPEEPVQTSGPLAGIRGVIEIDPIIAQPREAAGGLPQLKITPTQQQQVNLLRHLSEFAPSPIAATDTLPPTAPHPLLRLGLALLLLVTLIVGLYASNLPSEWFTPPPVPATAMDAYRTIEEAKGLPVLVAFDYTPAMGGELNAQAALLLQQLADNGNSVLAISQVPAGILLAEQLLADTPNLTYTNLGWLPGESIGLNQLAHCLVAGTICDNGDNIGVYGQPPRLILLLTSEQDALVNWMEQVGQQTDLPVVAGITQSLAPVAYPYYRNGQLHGMIEGMPALAAYERDLRQSGNQNTLLLNAQTFAIWLVVILLIVGNVWTWILGMMPRRNAGKRKSSAPKPSS